MNTIAERIRGNRISDFDEFDKVAFLNFVEEQVSRFGYVEIGIDYDRLFTDGYIKSRGKQVMKTDSKWLSFTEDYKCYIWRTNCQIPQKFVWDVDQLLISEGLHTSKKGACGYDTYDVIVAKL